MDFLEKDLEDIIWEAQSTREGRKKLKSRGLDIRGKVFRQFNLGEYGIPDLVSVYYSDRRAIITIYELKKDQINTNTLLQASRYYNAINRLASNMLDDWRIKVCLIGRNVELNGNFTFLADMIPCVSMYTYEINIDGLFFTMQYGYYLSESPIFDSMKPVFKLQEIREMRNGTNTDD